MSTLASFCPWSKPAISSFRLFNSDPWYKKQSLLCMTVKLRLFLTIWNFFFICKKEKKLFEIERYVKRSAIFHEKNSLCIVNKKFGECTLKIISQYSYFSSYKFFSSFYSEQQTKASKDDGLRTTIAKNAPSFIYFWLLFLDNVSNKMSMK